MLSLVTNNTDSQAPEQPFFKAPLPIRRPAYIAPLSGVTHSNGNTEPPRNTVTDPLRTPSLSYMVIDCTIEMPTTINKIKGMIERLQRNAATLEEEAIPRRPTPELWSLWETSVVHRKEIWEVVVKISAVLGATFGKVSVELHHNLNMAKNLLDHAFAEFKEAQKRMETQLLRMGEAHGMECIQEFGLPRRDPPTGSAEDSEDHFERLEVEDLARLFG